MYARDSLQDDSMDTIHAGKHGVAEFHTMYAACSLAGKGFSSIGMRSQAKPVMRWMSHGRMVQHARASKLGSLAGALSS